MTGAVVSRTVMVNEPEDELPAASLAVRMTVVVPMGNVEPEAALEVSEVTPTASVAVAAKLAVAPAALVASAVMFATGLITGGVVSRTVTLNELAAELPALSDAARLTVVVPSGNVLPEAGLATTETAPSTSSVALAVKFTNAPEGPMASAVMSAGAVMTGGVVSRDLARFG